MLRGVTAGTLHFRGLALRTFPFGILQPLPDGGLCHSLVTAAVVDHPVDHAVVVLHGHFSSTEGIVPLLHIGVHHRKGPGAVAHDVKPAIIGIVVDAIPGGLHLLP